MEVREEVIPFVSPSLNWRNALNDGVWLGAIIRVNLECSRRPVNSANQPNGAATVFIRFDPRRSGECSLQRSIAKSKP